MTLSFIFLIYGIRFVGQWIHAIELPIFACPNTDQIIHSYCYYLSHLNELFAYKSTSYILGYLGALIVLCLLFGRMMCGFLCPMGYLQDIAWKVREIVHMEGIQRKEKLVEVFKIIRYLLLFVFFGITFLGFDFCKICPAKMTTQAFAGFSQAITIGYLFSILIFIMSFFMRRFWCNICPLGYFVGLFHKISLFRLEKDCKACTKCSACYESCPMRIKSIYTEDKKANVTTSECIFCGECIKKCPENNALAIAIGKKKFYVSSRKDFEAYHIRHAKRKRRET